MANRSDNFTRADSASLGTPSDLGSAWVEAQGNFSISANIGGVTTLVSSRAYAYLEASSAIGESSITLNSTGDVGVVIRYVDINNFMVVTVSNLTLFKRVAGTFTSLGSSPYTPAAGDVVSVSVDASNLYTVKLNGVAKYTATDAANATGTKHGLRSASTGPLYRAFSFTDNGVANTAINPAVGSVAITGYAPTIAQTANQSIVPNVGNLTITGYAPAVSQPIAVLPNVGNITLTGYAPTISQPIAVLPNVGNIVITGYVPSISQPQGINPNVGTLALTGYAPNVTQNINTFITPNVGLLSITGYSPAITQSANQSIAPNVGNLSITGYAPSVTKTANQALTTSIGSLVVTGYAPTVIQAAGSLNIAPSTGGLNITGYAPLVEQSGAVINAGGFFIPNFNIKNDKKKIVEEAELPKVKYSAKQANALLDKLDNEYDLQIANEKAIVEEIKKIIKRANLIKQYEQKLADDEELDLVTNLMMMLID